MSISRTVDRLLGLATWARVEATRAFAGKLGQIWTSAHAGDKFQHWQSYGFQSRPLPGAIAMILSMGSHADQRIAFMVGDRRYTAELVAGEVRIGDDLGQYIWLKRTGIVVDAPSIKLGADAVLGVARATDPVSTSYAADFATWAAAVTAALSSLTSGTFTTPTPTAPSTGTITSGSTVALSE